MLISICMSVIFSIVAIDQITKIIYWNVTKPLIGDVIYLTSAWNDGAAFSILKGGKVFFIILTVIVLYIFIYILITRKISNKLYFRLTISVLMGGIIGNFIDRFLFGSVRDFIYIKPLGFVCNVADIAITIATIMLIVFILFIYKFDDDTKEKRRKVLDKKIKNEVSTE